MLKIKTVILTISIMAMMGVIIPQVASAQDISNTVTITPLNSEVSLKKIVMPMSVPVDNTFPWGTVKGGPSEYVERYPVIIQFYQGGEPVHVAQVDVRGDGSYEYRFRAGMLDSETGKFVNFFNGDYTVNVFRVVPNTDQTA